MSGISRPALQWARCTTRIRSRLTPSSSWWRSIVITLTDWWPRGYSVPFTWDEDPAESLPEDGWDGVILDPWLRVHVRAGGRIVGVAPRSMTVAGSTADWRVWTGLPFDTTGLVTAPEALAPVYCDVERDYAVYCEPAVWVHHRQHR